MTQNRRLFLQCLMVLGVERTIAPFIHSGTLFAQEKAEDQLEKLLSGSWELQTYTYTSSKKSYTSPKQIEAVAKFEEKNYEVNFSTHVSRMGIKRTRRASESGTYSVKDNGIRLFAEKASDKKEKGEEFLTDVTIKGDTMELKSNNGANSEIWKKVVESPQSEGVAR